MCRLTETEMRDLTGKYATELKQLESAGFTKHRESIKLLKKTNGNLEVVQHFLDAKRKLHDAKVRDARCKRPRGMKKAREPKIGEDSSSSDSDDDKKKDKKRKREEKKAARDSKKLAKAMKNVDLNQMANKEEKKESKEERKLRKQQEKEEKHKEKKEKKDKKEVAVLPADLSTVFVDGNNLIYVLHYVRSLALRRNMAGAERALQVIAQEWSKLVEYGVTLIFDDTNKDEMCGKFRVCSAKPLFSTSDEALITWAGKLAPEEAAKTLVFTSDRGLTTELAKFGVHVLKSKSFFEIVAPSLGKKENEFLDDWATRWLEEKLKM